MLHESSLHRLAARVVVLGTFAALFLAVGRTSSEVSARPLYATSPTLGTDLASFSVLGGSAVTCTGATTISGAVGVSPGSSITGFPPPVDAAHPCSAGGGTHFTDVSANSARADALLVLGTLDQPCTQDLTATPNLTGMNLVPGVYCSTSSLSLTGTLTLSGSGVWIFKTGSDLIIGSGSSVIGGDPCNVWWRISTSASLGTTASFIGNIFTDTASITMNNGATLNGRAIAGTIGLVSMINNTISGPICSSSQGSGSSSQGSGGSTSVPAVYAPSNYIQYEISQTVTALSSPGGAPASDSNGPIVLQPGSHWFGSPTLVLGSNGQYYIELFLGGTNHVFVPVGAVVNAPTGIPFPTSQSALSAPARLPSTGYPPSEQRQNPWFFLGAVGLLIIGAGAWTFRRARQHQ